MGVRPVCWGHPVGFGAWRDERNLWETFSYGLFAGEWAGSAELRQAADTGESGVMLLCLSNRVWCGEPLVVSGSEVVVVVEASFEL